MVKRHIILILPILSFWVWTYWIRGYCIFYIGSVAPCSTRVFFAVYIFDAMLFFLSVIAILFCFIQLLRIVCRKKSDKYILTRNIVLIVSYIFVFQIKPNPNYVPFALGLKNYYAKEVDLLQFQQWIESAQIKEAEWRLSEPYDKYNFPDPLLDDIQKISAVRIDIKRSPSGTLFLRLWSYMWLMGDYGFVIGANKDELPFDKHGPSEHRTEINNESFVWVRERL